MVCVDHMHLDDKRAILIMNSTSRYSVGDVVDTASMRNAIPLFESLWISPSWTPETVLFGPAFDNSEFIKYLKSHVIESRPIPPRRHNKNVPESQHRTIRDVRLRLRVEY